MATTRVEIDSDRPARLRERRPEQSIRELVEGVIRMQLGREANARARQRFAGAPS